MKFLFENWRKYLNEDLGKQVWANRAPLSSRHFGGEKDTRAERNLEGAFLAYILDDVSHAITPEDIEDIRKYMRDPRYNDVFVPYSGKGPLYRGMSLPLSHVEKFVGDLAKHPAQGKGDDWRRKPRVVRGVPNPEMSQPISVDFVYKPEEFYREGPASSWTDNRKVAVDFSTGGHYPGWSPHETYSPGISVVMVARPEDGDFLDMRSLYGYKEFERQNDEDEVVALGPVRVSEIEIEGYGVA